MKIQTHFNKQEIQKLELNNIHFKKVPIIKYMNFLKSNFLFNLSDVLSDYRIDNTYPWKQISEIMFFFGDSIHTNKQSAFLISVIIKESLLHLVCNIFNFIEFIFL